MKFLPTFSDMFDDLFHDPFNYSSVDAMRTDIVEKDGQYLMNMELPGYKKEDIQMELKDGYLIINATKNIDNEEKDDEGHVIRRERYSGSCSRNFYVGEGIKEEDIKASFDNGELKISIPKDTVKQVEEKKYISIE
ncbi:Hsp20/alpha crystallin family protein [Candidatus Stoquefichus sp. SB1]|jgi:HSP20 family protein|uniref:Hsp20/alpha crystallin family protein n=1 Tax=Candidatus Stoquefichus sp. SB1 TaxID=1658109 RepID=UPI00067E7DA3|nr:Hsp20/alpha crystallin family protein [Candidatus Stoquefichus sp. SB1]